MVRFVFPKGFEPLSSEPESEILSIELRERGCKDIQIFEINMDKDNNFLASSSWSKYILLNLTLEIFVHPSIFSTLHFFS